MPVSDLIDAIRCVQAGERIVPGPVALPACEQLRDEVLTARELEILPGAMETSSRAALACRRSH